MVLASCLALVFGMVGLSYAAVPLYDLYCRVTGYGGTPQRADAAPTTISDRIITVRFDTNTDAALPWTFQPEKRSVQVKVGENQRGWLKITDDHVTAEATTSSSG